MPRALFKVQGAPTKTRWTLAHDSPVQSPNDDKMQANGTYFERQPEPLSRYASYDGSQYSVGSSERMSMAGHRPSGIFNSSNSGVFDFNNQAPRQRATQQPLGVNTRVRSFHHQDAVGHHLLYETALLDSQTYEVLDIAEVDALKKEHVRLNSKIEAVQRKLTLESKVRNAAQNLQRLYSTSGRPDTPQSPESPKKGRSSLMPSMPRSNSRNSVSGQETLQQADSEWAMSVKKVDELHEQLTSLFDRRQHVERKLLRHTAAVLSEEANRNTESAVPGLINGHHGRGYDDEDDSGDYTPNDFDGIRDILRGMPAGYSVKAQQYEQQMASLQERLEQLNYQLRNVISEAGHTLGRPPSAEVGLDQSDDAVVRLENRFARLEHNLRALGQQQRDIQERNAVKQDSENTAQNEIERQLQNVNGQLHNALLMASESQAVPDLQEPPRASGNGYREQLQYLEDSLLTMEQLIQQHGHALASARDASDGASQAIEEARAEAATHAQRAQEASEEASRAIETAQAEAAAHAQRAHEAQEEATRAIEDAHAQAASHAQRAQDAHEEASRAIESAQSQAALHAQRAQEDAGRASEEAVAHTQKLQDALDEASRAVEQAHADAAAHAHRAQEAHEEAARAIEEAQAQAAAHAQKAEEAHEEASRAIEEAQAQAAAHAQKAQDAQEEAMRANELAKAAAEAQEQKVGDHYENAARSVEDAKSSAAVHAQKVGEYETVLGGLWDILQSDAPSPRPNIYEDSEDDEPAVPQTPLKESFSLQAFNARVQHLYDRAQSAREQQDILRRQIQQQRELNGKSDAEKDRQFTELQDQHEDLQSKHGELTQEHDLMQQESANIMVRHEQTEGEAGHYRAELANVMEEVESLKGILETRQQERDEMARQASGLRQQMEQLEAHLADLMEHGSGSADTQKEMDDLESEVVRLTTELVEAKAALDGAYGSRAERAGVQAAEVDSLTKHNREITDQLESLRSEHGSLLAELESLRGSSQQPSERSGQLERELSEITNDFQELAKESIELEKERGQLDGLIDALRDRCETLETQLLDERTRWLGVSSPNGAPQVNGREMTSTAVMRQEFKKMMREQKAEGIRLLRVCDDFPPWLCGRCVMMLTLLAG